MRHLTLVVTSLAAACLSACADRAPPTPLPPAPPTGEPPALDPVTGCPVGMPRWKCETIRGTEVPPPPPPQVR